MWMTMWIEMIERDEVEILGWLLVMNVVANGQKIGRFVQSARMHPAAGAVAASGGRNLQWFA